MTVRLKTNTHSIDSNVLNLANTSSKISLGSLVLNLAPRTRQSRFFTWSERITPNLIRDRANNSQSRSFIIG